MNNILTYIFILFITPVIYGQNYTHHVINGNIGGGLLMGHLQRINHLPKRKAFISDISYTKYSSYSPCFGVGINHINSGNKSDIGSITGLYGFTALRIRKKDSTLKFKIGFGGAYVQKIYNPNTNNKNIAISSHLNANVIFHIQKNFKFNQHALFLSGGLTHFSNGSLQAPNLGLNFLSVNLGYSIYSEKKNIAIPKVNPSVSKPKWSYGIAFSTGFRENFQYKYKKYAINTLNIYAILNKNEKRNYVGGLDITYNPSVQFYNSSFFPFQGGLFVGKQWVLNQLILGIDIGGYIYDEYKNDGVSFQRLNISYYLSPNIKTTFLLRTHWTVAQAFQIGVAYEFKN
jgi:hypothetical protein